MIRTVVVVLALASASTSALPFTTQESGNGVEGVPQIHLVGQQVEKTGVQSPEVYAQVQPVEKFTSNTGTSEQYTFLNTAQQAIAETQPSIQANQQNVAVPKTEGTPQTLSGNPVFLIPANPQVIQPVVVPSESLPTGRIIMAIDSIHQRNTQDESVTLGSPVQYQQVVQSVPYSQGGEPNQQSYYVQSVQGQNTPVQVQPNPSQFVREQTVAQTFYSQVPVEHGVYGGPQNTQPVVSVYAPGSTPSGVNQQQYDQQTVEKTIQTADYTPVQTAAENVHQVPYQQFDRVQNQQQGDEKRVPQQQSQQAKQPNSATEESVEKQLQYQQSQTQSVYPQHQQTQTVQRIVPNPPECTNQQVYSVRPGGQIENQSEYQQVKQTQTVVGQKPE